MGKKLISEQFAKAAIYIVTTFFIFGFVMFIRSAKEYNAILSENYPVRLESPMETVNAQTLMPEVDAAVFSPPDWRIPPVEGKEKISVEKPLDQDFLQAEIQRMQAQGFDLSVDQTEYVGVFYATSYCCEVYPHICGGNGVTASGTVPTQGRTIAADWRVFRPGTWVFIDGVGIRRVEDSGSAIKGNRIDVAVDTHANALRWPGQGRHDMWVLSRPPEKTK